MDMWGVSPPTPLDILKLLLFFGTDMKAKENDFRALKDPARQVDMVYQHIKRFTAFQEIFRVSQDRKSNDLSTRWRTEGNNHYRRHKDYLSAQECYTKSIAFAETGSSFLALSYANRSAVLFEKKYYKQALEDISRALSSDYPEHLRKKLEIRREKAEKLMHNQRSTGYYGPPPEIESKNPLISCASDAVEIQCNEKYGRHLIATRDIQVGEVISVENSFCHSIHSESRYQHCHQCLELCYNMIPCPGCVNALYCSEECLQKCYEQFHKYECRFPNVLLSSKNDFMKLTLIGNNDTCKQENEESPNYVYRSDSFQEIMKLEKHEDKLDYIFICSTVIVAAIGFHALKNDLEFTSNYSKNSNDDTLKRILYRSYLVNKFNPFYIGKDRHQPYIGSRIVGSALYGFTSLYNHSCIPNCAVSQYGTLIVTRAHAFIRKGEQITICYGCSYSKTPKIERQEILKTHYLFNCDCRACENDWPTKKNLEDGKSLPLAFEVKMFQYIYGDRDLKKRLMSELLREGKQLMYALQKYQPCNNYLRLLSLIIDIYTYQSNEDVEF